MALSSLSSRKNGFFVSNYNTIKLVFYVIIVGTIIIYTIATYQYVIRTVGNHPTTTTTTTSRSISSAVENHLRQDFVFNGNNNDNINGQPQKQQETSESSSSSATHNPLIGLLKRMNITNNDSDMFLNTGNDQIDLDQLWNNLKSLYFDYDSNNDTTTTQENELDPIVIGLETCEQYRTNVPNIDQRVVAVAGMFNTGTNAMQFHLEKNLNIKSLWQVPWGKHRIEAVRLNHTANGMHNAVKENVLPIIIVRDPFHWMRSMCKSPYAAKWKRSRNRCPNLVPTVDDIHKFYDKDKNIATNASFPVTVYFDKNQVISWDSLIHLYNDWYMQYYTVTDYPRLIIRFEDMIVNIPKLLQVIAQCMGTIIVPQNEFKYQVGEAKHHGSHSTYLSVLSKSGNTINRVKGLTADDLLYANQHLNHTFFVDTMHYLLPLSQAK